MMIIITVFSDLSRDNSEKTAFFSDDIWKSRLKSRGKYATLMSRKIPERKLTGPNTDRRINGIFKALCENRIIIFFTAWFLEHAGRRFEKAGD